MNLVLFKLVFETALPIREKSVYIYAAKSYMISHIKLLSYN